MLLGSKKGEGNIGLILVIILLIVLVLGVIYYLITLIYHSDSLLPNDVINSIINRDNKPSSSEVSASKEKEEKEPIEEKKKITATEYNPQFLTYIDKELTKQQVIELNEKVITNNSSNDKKVILTIKDGTIDNLKDDSKYKAKATYTEEFITTIEISEEIVEQTTVPETPVNQPQVPETPDEQAPVTE